MVRVTGNEASMVLVMGVTGSGKSRFVNLLRGGSVEEGDGLMSVTQECQIVRVKIGSELAYVVDTPGFDDTTRSDADIFEEITTFLATQYASGLALKGITFLHRITDVRMQGSTLSTMTMFKELCGDHALKSVVLLTTFWDKLSDKSIGARRQQELRQEFWLDMTAKGSQVRRFDGSRDMAEALVMRLVDRPPVVLQIQRDIMQQGKRLEDTGVGRKIATRLDRSLEEKDKELEDLEKQISKASKRRSSRDLKQLEERLGRKLTERERIYASRQKLKASLGPEINAKVEKQQKSSPIMDKIQFFASILGMTVSVTTNIVLPLLGVAF
ncbi:P-loop containing nucleoside triphosphate hydrolase protein [Hypoxylon trugodes]|uniref:P-loop containing nucleoside triphosphate hydrolase protein n=1 Tax=Hypoxylon trugodes TaxID=326681 RepID=UPI002197C861|nr:P-loop containing nucleoside triphosphate hydrolase protein [Hypoxylon trugodes]KAI1386329.1 P-loop containing nucleoside triphosphate hydrolase protein [Hypoxylon trugodes]